jgi:hypothetical protein
MSINLEQTNTNTNTNIYIIIIKIFLFLYVSLCLIGQMSLVLLINFFGQIIGYVSGLTLCFRIYFDFIIIYINFNNNVIFYFIKYILANI